MRENVSRQGKLKLLDSAGFDPGNQTNSAQDVLWEDPIPFDEISLPPFPVECLPGPIAEFVRQLSISTQTPTEMAGVLSLGILSTAFQSKYCVSINSDWQEPLCLFTAAVAKPGERKSGVIKDLTKPVREYETQRRETEKALVEQNQTEKRILKAKLANAEKNAATKKEGGQDYHDEALDYADQLANFKDIHPFRLLADDATPEKLVELMDAQNGCITIVSSEGGIFDLMQGRYEKSSNFDAYLKGHAGDPITIDRISRKVNFVPEPRLTMMLTVQPEVLNGLMSNAIFKGRGLPARFLYTICNSKVGSREVTPPTVSEEARLAYESFVYRILSETNTGVLRLNKDAHAAKTDYQIIVEQRLGEGNAWEFMTDWGNKLVGAMLRIAALIHCAEARGNPAEILINADAIKRAVNIAEVLSVHASAAYQTMGADETHSDAKYLLRRIKESEQEEISKRDLFRMCDGKFKKVEEMDPALQILENMEHVRIKEAKTGGRPTKKIFINPHLQKGQKGQNSF